MLLFRALLLVVCAIAYLPNAMAETPPTKETIATWWTAKSVEAMDVIGEPVEIHLRGREVAYLVDVAFNRGRNDTFHIAMVRPRLKEVREVAEPVAKIAQVQDLDRNGVSEVVAETIGSGQGTTSGVRVIVQFEGWTPLILHKAEFEEGCGSIGMDIGCYSKTVSWRFADLNGDGNLDLIEEITIKDSPPKKPSVTSKEPHMFLFNGSEFVESKKPVGAGR